MSEIPETPSKMIPWQDRERLGVLRAFFMTIYAAFFSPVDYFDKLEVRDDLREPWIFYFYNSLYLSSPFISQIFLLVPFLAIVAILVLTSLLLFVLTFLIQKVLTLFGEETNFKKTYYVLAFSSPAFLLIYIPGIGYWFAAVIYTVLAGIGLTSVHKLDFARIIPALVLVPLIVLLPFATVRFVQKWQIEHPVMDPQIEAQKILAALAIAAENYSLKNDGRYPPDSISLIHGPVQFLAVDYCGNIYYSYRISCDFRPFGYFLSAEPQGWKGRGKKRYYATTGGKLREERP